MLDRYLLVIISASAIGFGGCYGFLAWAILRPH